MRMNRICCKLTIYIYQNDFNDVCRVLVIQNPFQIFFNTTAVLSNALIANFQPSVAIHIENSHLLCRANQMNGFFMKLNTRLTGLRHWNGKRKAKSCQL